MCICSRTYTCIHTHMHIRVCVSVYVCVCVCVFLCIAWRDMNIFTRKLRLPHAWFRISHTYMHINVYVYTCVCVYTYIHTYIYTYIHTYIKIYLQTSFKPHSRPLRFCSPLARTRTSHNSSSFYSSQRTCQWYWATYIHSYIHIYIHTHTHTHTYLTSPFKPTHTRPLLPPPNSSSFYSSQRTR